jgi:polyhydroxybutyrate depolymerase
MLRAAAVLSILAGGLAGVAGGTAQAQVSNPCAYDTRDAPCSVQDGVYRALVPDGPGPHPVVVYLYGSLGISGNITRSRVFQRSIVQRGYALIVPAALDVRYVGDRIGTGWGRRARRDHPRDDLAFLRRVLIDAERRLRIDRKRVIFAGQSDGGFLIWEIACHTPEMGAAFAVHGASYGGSLPASCRQPVRFLATHGRRDDVVPFSGAMMRGRWQVAADVASGMALLAATGRCRDDAVTHPRFHGFDRLGWDDCAPGAAVDFLAHDGGHGWPAQWLPAVLDWFEATEVSPAVSATRRVGEAPTIGRFKAVGQAPARRAPGRTIGGFRSLP